MELGRRKCTVIICACVCQLTRDVLSHPRTLALAQSQNILLQIARETDNIDLLELKDDLAYNLQLCDQLTYGR